MGGADFFQENLMGQVLFFEGKVKIFYFLWVYLTGGKHVFLSGEDNGATSFLRIKNDGAKTFFDSKISENPVSRYILSLPL